MELLLMQDVYTGVFLEVYRTQVINIYEEVKHVKEFSFFDVVFSQLPVLDNQFRKIMFQFVIIRIEVYQYNILMSYSINILIIFHKYDYSYKRKRLKIKKKLTSYSNEECNL